MKSAKVNLKKRSYKILVGPGILKSCGKYIRSLNIGSDAFVITNAAIKKRYGGLLNDILEASGFSVRFKLIADSEKSKSLETASSVIRDIARYDRNRRLFIIALGGGVVGDLSGFVASIYKRGIPYVQIPTTLLAQVDSSIGGKTAVDLAQAKNLAGSFYQPRLVISDMELLKSLDKKQIRSGLSEVIKYALIRDRDLFRFLERNRKDVLALKNRALEYIVYTCSKIKAEIVSRDEREESGIRTTLNFGHTAGHAIEASGGYEGYNHGEAVALGMLVASRISVRIGLLKPQTERLIRGLIAKYGLPVFIRNIPLKKIINAHYHDKKFIGAKNRFVLLSGIGKTEIVTGVPLELIIEAIEGLFC
ncbi:MAG TPA: 3-dehydroquinate synthase [Candidatus Margulisiibacteriota bacterium]|nr:3-dehydroquinate synthase [Candidatus Margulisiibacteriota bacterium]